MPLPNTFILGAPKCGTTSLADWLNEHPAVFVSAEKEPHFFSAEEFPDGWMNWDEYRALFADAEAHPVRIDASTGYLRSQFAVPRILEHIADARFIVMLRNPVAMAPSLHRQRVWEMREPQADFRLAWQSQFDHEDSHDPALRYAWICRLGAQLETLLSRIDKHQLHLVFLEDLTSNWQSSALQIADFLQLETSSLPPFPRSNPARQARSTRLAAALKQIRLLRRRLKLPLPRTGLMARAQRANSSLRGQAALPDDLKHELQQYFADDIKLLSALTGRDLKHWTS